MSILLGVINMADGPQGGRTGRVMSKIHEVFHTRLVELRDQAKLLQNAIQGKAQREWQIPAGLQGSLLDIGSLHQPAFDRQSLNTEYETATKDPNNAGTNGDIINLKLQIDYNACEERAFRIRHNTLCRAMCLAHGRRFGQGHGNLWDEKNGIEAVMSAFIAAGGAAQPNGNTT